MGPAGLALALLLGQLTVTACLPDHYYPSQYASYLESSPAYGGDSGPYDDITREEEGVGMESEDSGLEDELESTTPEKRSSSKWGMRMFKRPASSKWQQRLFKRPSKWGMRMFKKSQPWKMRMFKKSEEDGEDGNLGEKMAVKRPASSKWQQRLFKRSASGGPRGGQSLVYA